MSDTILAVPQLIHSMAPSRDFRTTVDTSRPTTGLWIAPTTGTSYTVHNAITDTDVTLYTGGELVPVRTQEAVTVAGHQVVYLY